MFQRTFLLWTCIFILPHTILATNTSLGALRPIDQNHCEVLDKVLASTVYSTDYCIFMIMEQIDCVYRYMGDGHWTTVVVVSLDKMFSGFVAEAQKKFYCDKTFSMFDTWDTFRHFMVGRNFTKKFEPYTRLGFYARFNSSDHGKIFDEVHLRQVYLGALHVYYGRVLSEDLFELEDVLTGELVRYSNISHLETTYKTIRNYMLHPLFDTKINRNQVTVSLYHCDPFVIHIEGRNSTVR